jgi:adenosine deaminase
VCPLQERYRRYEFCWLVKDGNKREDLLMDLEDMSRDELIQKIEEMSDFMENVLVFWGGKREYRKTFEEVAKNEQGEYTDHEVHNAEIIVNQEGAFDLFVEMVRDSFERGGINYLISEKISVLMEEVASRYN